MYTDEAIKEIRDIRHKISAEFGHETKALLDHYKELEQNYKDRILSKGKKSKIDSTNNNLRTDTKR